MIEEHLAISSICDKWTSVCPHLRKERVPKGGYTVTRNPGQAEQYPTDCRFIAESYLIYKDGNFLSVLCFFDS